MTREATRIDISAMPELARLADEVARTGMPQVLERDNKPVALLVPVSHSARRQRIRRPTQNDIDAALATFGAWKAKVDTEQLKRDIKAARSDHRPPVEL